MAFYGTQFIERSAQGDGNIDLDSAPLSEDAEELTNQLAMAWLQAAAEGGQDANDQRQSWKELAIIHGEVGRSQGVRATVGRRPR